MLSEDFLLAQEGEKAAVWVNYLDGGERRLRGNNVGRDTDARRTTGVVTGRGNGITLVTR